MIAILQNVNPYSFVQAYDHFIGSCCLHYQDTRMLEDPVAVGTLLPDSYRYKQHIVKHNSINGFIKVHFLHYFIQRHVLALVMSHLQVDHFLS
jgi:hypothetical protein